MADVREVGFELERFGWTAPGRLEVIGRWSGLQGRRLGRPVLTLDVGGQRRRLTALPGGHLAPSESGQWRAAFAFEGDPEDVIGAELEIGRRLVVDLPRPRRKRRRPSESDRVSAELADLRREIAELRSLGVRTAGADEAPDEPAAAPEDRRRREAAEAALAERDAEIAALRARIGDADAEREQRGLAERELRAEVERIGGELAGLRAAHEKLESEHTELRRQSAEADEVNERLITELGELREAVKTSESERERLAAEAAQLSSDLAARATELAQARQEAETAHTDAGERLEAERALST
jgi:hypothetical protein